MKPKSLGVSGLFVESKNGGIIPNPRLKVVKENAAREVARLKEQRIVKAYTKLAKRMIELNARTEKSANGIKTKIKAYETAWRVIRVWNKRSDDAIIQEAWWIVKRLSPAKGKSKVGRRAGFRRVFGATAQNPKELELKKVSVYQAERFLQLFEDRKNY